MKAVRYLPALSIVILALPLQNCGRPDRADAKAPFVESVDQQPAPAPLADQVLLNTPTGQAVVQTDAQMVAVQAAPASVAVEGQLKLVKASIFDRVFLYGFDLQYSSGADAEYELIPQAMALGHVPSFFRRVGNTLQLVAEQSRLFESNINHPELLINEYLIVAEDSETLTVDFARGGIVLNQVINGREAGVPRQTWIRSIEYQVDRNILMQETGLLLADGSVATFMESLLPRAALVPADYKGLEANAVNEPLAGRYRFLAAESVFVDVEEKSEVVREKTAFASRFHLGENGTIDWYVTPNVPEKFIPVLKSGIEGWNRYFNPQLGRDVVRFLGRLPAGRKLGDPTLNIVNWDSVAEAGAAYESQAVDPLSGIQSHSLIYLPLAWYNIGVSLWKNRVDDQSIDEPTLSRILSPKSPEVLFGRRNILRCMRSADQLAAPIAQMIKDLGSKGNPSQISVDDFGMRLVAAVLFHEVGHALGLAHNFKASLSYDGNLPAGAGNPTTHSSMDYNYYQLEVDLFEKLGEVQGPVLEYDRQIISQLYNQGKDVLATDPVLAACDDTEADATVNGVDPLCVRYDSEKNPIDGVLHAFNNIANGTGAKGPEAKTLAEVLVEVQADIIAEIANQEKVSGAQQLQDRSTALGDKVGDLINYYIATGAQSLRINLRNNEKALRVWQAGLTVDETAFRSQYLQLMKTSLALKELPATPAVALATLVADFERAALLNESIGAIVEERSEVAAKAKAAFEKAVSGKTQQGLSRIRQAVYGILAFSPTNPFALRLSPTGEIVNIEDLAFGILRDGLLESLSGQPSVRSSLAAERAAAATQLKSFAGVNAAYSDVQAKLKEILAQALTSGDHALVKETRSLIKSLE